MDIDHSNANGRRHLHHGTLHTFIPEHLLGTAAKGMQIESIQQGAVNEFDQGVSYEPERRIPDATPPKRFYRTFWRSAARRVLEHELLRTKALLLQLSSTNDREFLATIK